MVLDSRTNTKRGTCSERLKWTAIYVSRFYGRDFNSGKTKLAKGPRGEEVTFQDLYCTINSGKYLKGATSE